MSLSATVKRIRASFHEALESEALVTIKLDSGTVLTGFVTAHPTLPDGYFLIVDPVGTTRRAFHRAELEEVIFE